MLRLLSLVLALAGSGSPSPSLKAEVLAKLPGTSGSDFVAFDNGGSLLAVCGQSTTIFDLNRMRNVVHLRSPSFCHFIAGPQPRTFLGVTLHSVFEIKDEKLHTVCKIASPYMPAPGNSSVPCTLAYRDKDNSVLFEYGSKLFALRIDTGILSSAATCYVSSENAFFFQDKLLCAGDGGPEISSNGSTRFLFDSKRIIGHVCLNEKSGVLYATDYPGGILEAINLRTGDVLYRAALRQPPSCIACSPNGDVLALGLAEELPRRDPRFSRNGILFLNAKTGKPLKSQLISTTAVNYLAFSPNGRFLVDVERSSPAKVMRIRLPHDTNERRR